jgi:8-oxo-dGTP pyrophosphatase MutT (NUDIX family)
MEEKLIQTEKNIPYIRGESVVETYLADVLPDVDNCPSAYALVFKDGALLLTDLREGERPTRGLDIPGGHVDEGETPEESVVREAFEETGVRVKVIKLVAYKRVTILSSKPENYRYPYPISYMAFYLCEALEETPFEGNEDTHGRVWLKKEYFNESDWCVRNKIFLDAVIFSK